MSYEPDKRGDYSKTNSVLNSLFSAGMKLISLLGCFVVDFDVMST